MFSQSIVTSAVTGRAPLHAIPTPSSEGDCKPLCTICRRPVNSSFAVDGYRLFACRTCDFVFIDPAVDEVLDSTSLFDDAYFHGGGAGYTNYVDEGALLRAHGERYGKMLARSGARRVLDVGSAAGFVLRGLIDAGCSGIGLEPNRAMARYAAGVLGLDVRTSTLEHFEAGGASFDAVAMLQVVDHLDDIRCSLARVRDLTVIGGWCLVEFGDRASLTARVLGAGWHEYAPPTVRRVFSLHALRSLFGEYGFGLVASGHPPKYLRADHALSVLRYKAGTYKAGAPLARAVLERVAAAIPAGITMRYPGDDITWALFRKSTDPEISCP